MKREEILNCIFSQFDQSAKLFCEDTQGIFCEISKEYKGEYEPQNLKFCFAKIYYHSFAVKLTYTAHGTMNVVNSILGCSVCFDKTDDSIEIPLPLVTDYCDVDIIAPMFIPFITNETGMVQAFDCIGSVLKQLFAKLVDISCDPEYKNRILTTYTDEIKHIFETDISIEILNRELYDFFTLRFTSTAFINFLKGNRTKAIAQLKKTKKLTGYETRMLKLWTLQKQSEIPNLPSVIANADTYNEHGVQKTNFKEFGIMLLSWLLMAPAASVPFIGLYFLLVWIEGRASVYLLGPIYNFPFCILFGFITAIAASYFTRFKFYNWLSKKDYEKYCEMDSVQNGGGADKLMKGFVAVISVIGVVGCVFLAKWNLNFLSDGFIDNSKFLSLQGNYYSYNEIERVYYKPDRVNDFGQTLDFPSYVLVLENSKEIDLYEYGEISDYENKLIKHFRDKGVKVEGSSP